MAAMFISLFGGLKDGRLKRLPFIIYLTVLQLVLLAYVIWVGVAAGLGDIALAGDLEQAQQRLTDFLSPALLLVTVVLICVLAFAHLNIIAKRIRDIGLPGWWALLAFVIFRLLVSALGYGWLAALLEFIALTALCFVNSDAYRRTAAA